MNKKYFILMKIVYIFFIDLIKIQNYLLNKMFIIYN